jgi:ABC-type Mn2+/Zn2+ transport system ATPase subunit
LAIAESVLMVQGATDHAASTDGTAGDRGTDVLVVVYDIGQRLDLIKRVIGLDREVHARGPAEDEVGLLAQFLQHAQHLPRHK